MRKSEAMICDGVGDPRCPLVVNPIITFPFFPPKGWYHPCSLQKCIFINELSIVLNCVCSVSELALLVVLCMHFFTDMCLFSNFFPQEKAKRLGKGDEKLDSEVILKFLKVRNYYSGIWDQVEPWIFCDALWWLQLILKMWGDELNSRTDEEKCSFRGKMDSASHTQTVSYIKPLFRKLKHCVRHPPSFIFHVNIIRTDVKLWCLQELSSDILECLADIVKFLLDRHYLKVSHVGGFVFNWQGFHLYGWSRLRPMMHT